MDDLENPEATVELEAVRERNRREADDARRKLGWRTEDIILVLTFAVPIVVLVIYLILMSFSM